MLQIRAIPPTRLDMAQAQVEVEPNFGALALIAPAQDV
jgi:hypothetical protein